MSQDVVLDTDFLSAFLKIDRLDLIKDFFQTEVLLIPSAVFGEVSPTRFFAKLAQCPFVRVTDPDPAVLSSLSLERGFTELGPGEKEAIALVRQLSGSVLLINDNRARLWASAIGLHCFGIPAFLLACKRTQVVDSRGIADLVLALEEKDRYRFRKDALDLLLS